MSHAVRPAICLSIILGLAVTLAAQQGDSALAVVITAATTGDEVRFAAPADISQLQLRIIGDTGEALFESAWHDGNVLDWSIESAGPPLGSGSYRCVVIARDLKGVETRREAILVAAGRHVSLQQQSGGDALTIVHADAPGPKMVMHSHDGENGAIVSTSGDLSFRFGQFLAGRDGEAMRLTAGGHLGIGTDQPQTPLDVNGLIRTSKGILFADGTILTTAAGPETAVDRGGEPGRRRLVIPALVTGGIQPGSQTAFPATKGLKPRAAAVPDHQFKVDGLGVHIGTTSAFGLDVAGNVTLASNLVLPATSADALSGVITSNGKPLLHGRGFNNVFLGTDSGNFTMSSNNNMVAGALAFQFNETGHDNTAVGVFALHDNGDGSSNVAIGSNALGFHYSGDSNVAVGKYALFYNGSGHDNIGVGTGAGVQLTAGGESNNIDIGNSGVSGESNTIRIGSTDSFAGFIPHNRFFVAGVRGVTTGRADGLAVVIDSLGQLGTLSSSGSVKREVSDIGETSDALLRLRPVSFYYRRDAAGIRQYGLIAEEVAEVMPDLVQFSSSGMAETVRYQFLVPLLLNEVQKQDQRIAQQQLDNAALCARLERLERAFEELRAEGQSEKPF